MNRHINLKNMNLVKKIYLFCLFGSIALFVPSTRTMQEDPIVIEQFCYRCGNDSGTRAFNIFYRCKSYHPEKLCTTCFQQLKISAEKGKNPAQCPICYMNSWQLPDNAPPSPIKLTAEEFNFIHDVSDTYNVHFYRESSAGSSSKIFACKQEASRSFKIMSLCIAVIAAALGKYIWHKFKRNRKTLPTEQSPNIPDTTTQTGKQ